MSNIREDSQKVSEAHRLADLIGNSLADKDLSFRDKRGTPVGSIQREIADALLDIWQKEAQ